MKPKLGRPLKYKVAPHRMNILLPKHLYARLKNHLDAGPVHESISEFIQKAVLQRLKSQK